MGSVRSCDRRLCDVYWEGNERMDRFAALIFWRKGFDASYIWVAGSDRNLLNFCQRNNLYYRNLAMI